MAENEKNKRVTELVRRAQYARRRDSNQAAADAVKEALTLDPENEHARKLFERLSISGGTAVDVLQLCRDYHQGNIAKEGFRHAIESSAIDVEGTRETFEFTFEHKNQRSDDIVDALLTKLNGRRALMPMLVDEPTATFRALWDLGEASMRGLVSAVLLQPAAWNKEDERRQAEKDVLMLLLAKLLEPGQEQPEMAMLGIARLLAIDVDVLKEVVDSDAYTILLEVLDPAHSAASRSQATVALAKLYESTPAQWEEELTSFVEYMAKTHEIDKLITACAAVSGLFPVAPPICAKMFLKEGFVQQLMHLVSTTNSSRFKEAALELFSAACVDPPCRQTIQKYCADWLSLISIDEEESGKQSKLALTAALVNSKIRDNSKKVGGADDKLVQRLKRIVLGQNSTNEDMEKAIEGLQYQTIHAEVKENLVNDSSFMKRLVAFLSKPENATHGPLVYVGLTVFQNLTRYPPVLSQEDRKIAELKAYANRTSLPRTNPLDEEGPVSDRCTKVLDAGISTVFVNAFKRASISLHLVISSIILALSKHPRHRGKMAKAGIFDMALAQATSDLNKAAPITLRRQSALACARIMIPIDPNLLFRDRDVRPVIRILHFLIKVPASENETDTDMLWWRGFPVVTAIQALTNLATFEQSPSEILMASELIIQECWDTLEDLWTNPAIQIRTAVTECFLNLSMTEKGAAKFLAEGGASQRRMRILVGYWSEEEESLAEAAGGALATILGLRDERAVEMFAATESGVESTAEAIRSRKHGMIRRGLVIAQEIMRWIEEDGWHTHLAGRLMKTMKACKMVPALRTVPEEPYDLEGDVQHCIDVIESWWRDQQKTPR